MKFFPEKCKIEDKPMHPFIDYNEIWQHINNTKPEKQWIRDIIKKSLNKERLTLKETAALVNTNDADLIQEIKQGAKELKEKIYGNRIVLFSPLYIGNKCINNCNYCGFKSTNTYTLRKTLTDEEIKAEVETLESKGQKRLIIVFGEHPDYNAEYIAHVVQLIYSVKKNKGEIRRININAAPFDVDGFKEIKKSGIGTYQIFQETYNPQAYKWYHTGGKKADYEWRLTALDRAQEAGLDDVGIGVLFGLYDWRFEVLGLIRHTIHLEACYNIGPHTISVPRIKDASGLKYDNKYQVNDEDFKKIIAILRLAVPYTGLILTARESAELRNECLKYGITQIDGGTIIELGGYSQPKFKNNDQNLNNKQFKINDTRSLNDIIKELIEADYLPSFCTACYRKSRTGEHFMEISRPGHIKNLCTPNAILTLAEYLLDYATPDVQQLGWKKIEKELSKLEQYHNIHELKKRLELIKNGERDLYF
ncbi:MAG: [FeFe] hydrogenase H-cluster radical SAM maturase HydG [Bacteroidales bacterium]|nr:[FeFe] hydrogenase H-cluster radical SAM maturase HydG [Bacteroidales bacterium]